MRAKLVGLGLTEHQVDTVIYQAAKAVHGKRARRDDALRAAHVLVAAGVSLPELYGYLTVLPDIAYVHAETMADTAADIADSCREGAFHYWWPFDPPPRVLAYGSEYLVWVSYGRSVEGAADMPPSLWQRALALLERMA